MAHDWLIIAAVLSLGTSRTHFVFMVLAIILGLFAMLPAPVLQP